MASMLLSCDPERNWFRIAKASLISSTRPALTSASAPFSMTRRLPLPARRTFASIDRTTGSLLNPAPPLPEGMPGWQRFAAQASHVVFYGLMLALALVGWGMLSAARYPIVLYGPLQLPPILPHDAAL